MNDFNPKENSTSYILKSLIPYTDPNMKLAFKPVIFFNELDRHDKRAGSEGPFSIHTFKSSYYKSKQKGYFTLTDEGRPQLSPKGQKKLKKFKPKRLENASLLVTFDIPEKYRKSRDAFRGLLVALYFKQVQRSVWISEYDSREILELEIERLHLHGEVKIYEARELT